jgi:hypothetical protein
MVFKMNFSIFYKKKIKKKTWKIVLENVKYFLSNKHLKIDQFVKIIIEKIIIIIIIIISILFIKKSFVQFVMTTHWN